MNSWFICFDFLPITIPQLSIMNGGRQVTSSWLERNHCLPNWGKDIIIELPHIDVDVACCQAKITANTFFFFICIWYSNFKTLWDVLPCPTLITQLSYYQIFRTKMTISCRFMKTSGPSMWLKYWINGLKFNWWIIDPIHSIYIKILIIYNISNKIW